MFEEKFYRFCDKSVTVIKGLIGTLLCLMLLVVVFQVFWRDILNLNSPWTEEISAILITYITFIGGIAVMIRGEHLAIDLVTEHCSPKIREWIRILYSVVFIFVCTWLALYGTQFCLNPLLQKQTSIATGIPRVYIYMIMPITMILCDIYCVANLFFVIKNKITNNNSNACDIEHRDEDSAEGKDPLI